ncbi:hypothetical protein ACSAZL_08675 [Methanosarcina sp. T3]
MKFKIPEVWNGVPEVPQPLRGGNQEVRFAVIGALKIVGEAKRITT